MTSELINVPTQRYSQLPSQLPLGITLADSADFSNFLPGKNTEALASLQSLTEPLIYIWGKPGCGKTHLLQAACADTLQHEQPAAWLPMQRSDEFLPEILTGWENLPLVCLDDIHAIAGNAPWEQAVFNLYNDLHAQGGRLIIAANVAPAALGLQLPDLQSRLSHGLVFQLHELSDSDKCQALAERARRRGFELPEDTANYLLTRYQRDMTSLCQLLDVLDSASLSEKRRLTIPFVKKVLPA